MKNQNLHGVLVFLNLLIISYGVASYPQSRDIDLSNAYPHGFSALFWRLPEEWKRNIPVNVFHAARGKRLYPLLDRLDKTTDNSRREYDTELVKKLKDNGVDGGLYFFDGARANRFH